MDGQTNHFQEQSLFSISWPLFIELALHMGMGIMATLMLSHYSDDAAAGVGVANQLLNIFILVFNVTSIGAKFDRALDRGLKSFKISLPVSLSFPFNKVIEEEPNAKEGALFRGHPFFIKEKDPWGYFACFDPFLAKVMMDKQSYNLPINLHQTSP